MVKILTALNMGSDDNCWDYFINDADSDFDSIFGKQIIFGVGWDKLISTTGQVLLTYTKRTAHVKRSLVESKFSE